MELFSYQARDARGGLVSGTIEAESVSEAGKALRRDGMYILEITEGVSRQEDSAEEAFENRQASRGAKREEVIDFSHQLAVMLETGVPLGEALGTIVDNSSSIGFRRVVSIVNEDVSSGATLSSSLARWPKVFPPLMISLVLASEASGTLGLMMGRVSKYLSKELKTAKQIKSALTYPIVMMCLALGITVFLMVFVLPRFASIYANRDAQLPMPTRIMLGLSGFWSDHWILIVLGGIAAAAAVFMFAKRPTGTRFFDSVKLRLPIIGPMFTKLYITRSARTMSTLIASGVDLLETVRITRGITDNIYFQELWSRVIEALAQGAPFSETLRQSTLIPDNVTQMISAGEKTGRLGQVMERIGEVSEDELDEAVEHATQFIEPAMIGAMGIVIGFVAIAMLLPIFSISKVVAH